jgi:hypothetical protein
MIDPLSRAGRDLKAAEEFFDLAKTAGIPKVRICRRQLLRAIGMEAGFAR